MRVLVACEYSGVVRDAFKALGHDAWSCDILPTESLGNHIQGNCLEILNSGWDLMIAHPPCTHIAVSGSRHFRQKILDGRQQSGIDFFIKLVNAPIAKIAIENPVSIMSSKYRRPDQYIHPYEFGDPVSKKTCLWLKGLPPLVPTRIVKPTKTQTTSGRVYDSWWLWTSSLPSKIRGKVRSKTFPGIAKAMAEQWG